MTSDPHDKAVEAQDAMAESDAREARDDDPDVEAHMPKIIKLGAEGPEAAADA